MVSPGGGRLVFCCFPLAKSLLTSIILLVIATRFTLRYTPRISCAGEHAILCRLYSTDSYIWSEGAKKMEASVIYVVGHPFCVFSGMFNAKRSKVWTIDHSP